MSYKINIKSVAEKALNSHQLSTFVSLWTPKHADENTIEVDIKSGHWSNTNTGEKGDNIVTFYAHVYDINAENAAFRLALLFDMSIRTAFHHKSPLENN